MGRDKARLLIDEEPLAVRTASLLQRVVSLTIEVGPGITGLPSTREANPGEGPLVAVAAGERHLRSRSHTGAALVLACDLPLLSEPLLRLLIEWPTIGSVVPVVDGHLQPLCARWSGDDLARASHLAAAGARSLRHVVAQSDVTLLDESQWSSVADATTFADVDTPEDLWRLGIIAAFATDDREDASP